MGVLCKDCAEVLQERARLSAGCTQGRQEEGCRQGDRAKFLQGIAGGLGHGALVQVHNFLQPTHITEHDVLQPEKEAFLEKMVNSTDEKYTLNVWKDEIEHYKIAKVLLEMIRQ